MSRTTLERTLTRRRRLLLALWLCATAALMARAWVVQVREGEQWRQVAQSQHRTTREVSPPRGRILDRNGMPLAESREVARVSVAPGEIRDSARVREALSGVLGLSSADVARHTDPARRWSVIPGAYDPFVSQALDGVRGLHVEREHRRFYPRGDLARGVLGAVIDGVGRGGIEEVYDAILRGQPGRRAAARDSRGREIPGESYLVEDPVAGGDVRLTLDLHLQEIAHEALSSALASTGARAGDLIMTDPRSGEILALVSMRGGRADALSAVNAPYEPGSTLKPFTVATVLASGVGRLTDSIDTDEGVVGHPMTDTRPHGRLTLAEALRVSSNVGVARAAAALDAGQHYQGLRDFGFGVQTGVPLPGEVAGTLRRPDRWSAMSSASLAIGYEISVTPLQMAMAYGALANGGVLLGPRLVAEVRQPDGPVSARPREIRQVVPPAVAREMGRVLVEAVEEGTGTAARLETFQVAGKTGTSRAYTEGGGYGGGHFSSFASFFPADDPQLVVFVKLDSPRGDYYGGATAAPVTRATMEAALAARQTPLDRGALLRSARRRAEPPAAGASPREEAPPAAGAGVRFATLPLPPSGSVPAPPELDRSAAPGTAASVPASAPAPEQRLAAGVAVPDVRGLAPRLAARRLHVAGLRVWWDGGGQVVGSFPQAGSRLLPGDTVRLVTAPMYRP